MKFYNNFKHDIKRKISKFVDYFWACLLIGAFILLIICLIVSVKNSIQKEKQEDYQKNSYCNPACAPDILMKDGCYADRAICIGSEKLYVKKFK